MQKILLPDYLDGTVVPKNATLYFFKCICDYAKHVLATGHTQLGINLQAASNEEINAQELLKMLQYDESISIFLRAYHEYITHPHKNYVVAQTLTKAFSETKIDIKGKFLPKDFTAFFEITGLKDHEGDEIKGIFVRINDFGIYIGLLTLNTVSNSYSAGHFFSDLPGEDESIESKLESYQFTQIGGNLRNKKVDDIMAMIEEGEMPDIKKSPSTYYSHWHVIFNSILYVNHCEELKEEINTFATKKTKREWEVKHYTSRPYVFVGRNFQVPRSYTNEEILVRGHWKWQPYGPGWSLLKFIYIDPYLKNKAP